MSQDVYNQWSAKHGKDGIRIGHDACLLWFVVKDRKWKKIDGVRTLKQVREAAHVIFHDGVKCDEQLEWVLDKPTRAQVLGECPVCLNPEMDTDLKTYRCCPDCGWRIDFTPEQIERLERMLKAPQW